MCFAADNESPIVSDEEDETDTTGVVPMDVDIKLEPQEPQQQLLQLQQQLQQQQQQLQQQNAAAAASDPSRKPQPHVPVTATLPAIQPPVPAALAPKRLAVNATTPIVLAPYDQSSASHAMLAMPSARGRCIC